MNEAAVLVERLVRLRYVVVILNVRGHVNDLVGDNAGLLVDLAEGSLDKAVLVDLREGREVGDKTDVGSFRGLDRTHAAVVGVVNVTYLEARSVSRETAGAERRKTALVCKLGERIGLIHELRERRGTEEFLDCRGNGTDIDKGVRREVLHVLRLGCHSLADNSFES